jgi:hypothetical protein
MMAKIMVLACLDSNLEILFVRVIRMRLRFWGETASGCERGREIWLARVSNWIVLLF